MPCTGGPSGEQLENARLTREVRKERERSSKLEVLLCSACRSLVSLGFDFGVNPELDRWWAGHERKDIERRREAAKEQLRTQRALHLSETKTWAEMTPKERALVARVVGLDR